jgi:hypothetical protein
MSQRKSFFLSCFLGYFLIATKSLNSTLLSPLY